jgi:hypothetical protein
MSRPANGQASPSSLVTVQTGTYAGRPYVMQLERATAYAFADARADGGLSISPPLGANRSLDAQAKLKVNPSAYGSNLKPSQIRDPGFSTHGYGDCVDIGAGNAWFQQHCGDYGFVRESPAGESNHYRYLHPTWASAPRLNSTQRQAGLAPVNARWGANTLSKTVDGRRVHSGEVADFSGYVIGQQVTIGGEISDVWYISHLGLYYAAAGFTSQSTAGLVNRTPVLVPPSAPVVTEKPTVVPPIPVPVRDHNRGASLAQGEVLLVGDYLQNGIFRLTVGNNGLLVETEGSDRLVWVTSRSKALLIGAYSKTYAILQPDGNFVLYGYNKKGARFVLYAAMTILPKYRKPGEELILSSNGRLVVQPAGAVGKEIVKAS